MQEYISFEHLGLLVRNLLEVIYFDHVIFVYHSIYKKLFTNAVLTKTVDAEHKCFIVSQR